MECDTAYMVQVAVCDEHCLLMNSRLWAAADVQGKLAPGQNEASLLQHRLPRRWPVQPINQHQHAYVGAAGNMLLGDLTSVKIS